MCRVVHCHLPASMRCGRACQAQPGWEHPNHCPLFRRSFAIAGRIHKKARSFKFK
ncbi:hypothetical protein K788_0004448 [Paraburkholderia caribensis MBA4]|uniref:Uncharacterized protein n=1 Tax=Paraburkholderia caribensis MBA4 TaxID=1323664 RepID=A0A0P0RAG0_9BURK|nr:hypothetical protein K788_0004448 [Paraburkholderia caribensis MBA4]